MQVSGNSISITEEDLQPHIKRAEADLNEVEWRPVRPPTVQKATSLSIVGTFGSEGVPEKISLWQVAREFCGGDLILSDEIHHVLSVLKRGLQISSQVESLYVKTAGLESMELKNSAATLPQSQVPEFSGKQTARAFIALWSMATYTVWALSGYMNEEVSNVSMDPPRIPECSLSSSVVARQCALFYLGKGLSDASVSNDLAFIKYTTLYFRSLLSELKLRLPLAYTEPFADKKYQLEKSEFVLAGFDEVTERAIVSVEVDPKQFSEIVGNDRAKLATERLIDRICAYDFATKTNPFTKLNGIARIRAGYGFAGTGKTLLAKATATRFRERCNHLGYPIRIHEFPGNMISSLQGQSGERMDAWMRPFRDTSSIIYAYVDDAETMFEDRTRQQASEGGRLVVGSFLRNTEGASAIDRGNWLMDFLTNLLEQVDPAVRSRFIARFPIDGAITAEQFAAQDYLWWKQYIAIDPTMIDIVTPTGYDYLNLKGANVEKTIRYRVAKHERVRAIVDRVSKKYDLKHHLFFGTLFEEMKKEFPTFTSRDDRNIQIAVSSRMLDFDFEQDWRDNPKIFYHRDPATKEGMIMELTKANMKGLSFSDIRLEEALFYLDNFASVANVEFERQVTQEIQARRVVTEAINRLGK